MLASTITCILTDVSKRQAGFIDEAEAQSQLYLGITLMSMLTVGKMNTDLIIT